MPPMEEDWDKEMLGSSAAGELFAKVPVQPQENLAVSASRTTPADVKRVRRKRHRRSRAEAKWLGGGDIRRGREMEEAFLKTMGIETPKPPEVVWRNGEAFFLG